MAERVFVMSPDQRDAIGGIKQMYRHVDVLNKYGIEAKILHEKKGFRCTWFENKTPVTSWPELQWKDDDILVLPEIFGPKMTQTLTIKKRKTIFDQTRYYNEIQLPPVRKVIFNQNGYNTFALYGFDPTDITTAYHDPTVVATIVVSNDSRDYLLNIFPHHPVYRIRNAINPKLFTFHKQKKKQICFMPRKHRDEAEQVINIAKFRGALDGYSVVPIENVSEGEVASIMKESLIFLSFGYPEGLPLPPMEAMVSGCILVGYHGGGAREYFLPSHSFPIEAADVRNFAKTLEEVLQEYQRDSIRLDAMRAAGSRYIVENYSPAGEELDICNAWEKILGYKPDKFI